jgi:hypothetical protein
MYAQIRPTGHVIVHMTVDMAFTWRVTLYGKLGKLTGLTEAILGLVLEKGVGDPKKDGVRIP